VERRQRALDARQIELERFEQTLNAREQALDSAEGDLEQRRRLRIGETLPQATSA
jgi:Tfp pilus assembly protein PilN